MSPAPTNDLTARLDAIDDKIHDLLIRRVALAEKTAPVSPARGMKTLRRLAARHTGRLSVAGLARIWCEIAAAMPGAAPIVHVFAGSSVAAYRDLARAYFGSAAAMEGHPSASAVIHACASDVSSFGLLPPPDSDENERPWWAQLTPSGQSGPRVIARLPLVGAGEMPSGAYAIGSLELEPTGADISLFILEGSAQLSRAKLQALVKQAGLDTQLVAVGRDSIRSASRLHLLEILGFVPRDDSRLGVLLEQSDETVLRLVCVGGYAAPVAESKSARS